MEWNEKLSCKNFSLHYYYSKKFFLMQKNFIIDRKNFLCYYNNVKRGDKNGVNGNKIKQ